MSDRAISNAESLKKQLLERKKALQAELLGIDDQLGRIDRFLKDWRLFSDANQLGLDHIPVNTEFDRENKEGSTHTGVRRSRPKNSPKEEVAEAAREFIRERGVPIMRDDLFDLLTAHGFNIQGKDPRMVLSTMLWRMKDKVVRLKSGGYWLAEVPNEAAGYDPNETSDFEKLLNQPVAEILDPDSEEYKDASENAG